MEPEESAEPEERALFEAARAIRGYLPELVPDRAAEIDAGLGAALALGPAEAAPRLAELLGSEVELLDWTAELIADPELRPPDVARSVKAYQSLPGAQSPVAAERYVCPAGTDRVWYRRSAGQPVPRCSVHGVELVAERLRPAAGAS
ncbi:hypothetical protein ACFC6L_30730 [Kitasatospora phosalacinea]|uniref:hypothetical protein n=1 Tax=Kitasatospora phosalacinea TaxID=2065 RepID=UPI0035E18340